MILASSHVGWGGAQNLVVDRVSSPSSPSLSSSSMSDVVSSGSIGSPPGARREASASVAGARAAAAAGGGGGDEDDDFLLEISMSGDTTAAEEERGVGVGAHSSDAGGSRRIRDSDDDYDYDGSKQRRSSRAGGGTLGVSGDSAANAKSRCESEYDGRFDTTNHEFDQSREYFDQSQGGFGWGKYTSNVGMSRSMLVDDSLETSLGIGKIGSFHLTAAMAALGDTTVLSSTTALLSPSPRPQDKAVDVGKANNLHPALGHGDRGATSASASQEEEVGVGDGKDNIEEVQQGYDGAQRKSKGAQEKNDGAQGPPAPPPKRASSNGPRPAVSTRSALKTPHTPPGVPPVRRRSPSPPSRSSPSSRPSAPSPDSRRPRPPRSPHVPAAVNGYSSPGATAVNGASPRYSPRVPLPKASPGRRPRGVVADSSEAPIREPTIGTLAAAAEPTIECLEDSRAKASAEGAGIGGREVARERCGGGRRSVSPEGGVGRGGYEEGAVIRMISNLSLSGAEKR